jgi:hypothetical protein
VQPARLRDGRTTGDRGHDRRPQPPRVIVIAIHPTQAVSTPVLVRDQSASNNVFPYPAGAQTKATSAPAPASRPAHSSARATNPDGSDGTVIFTRGTSTNAISSSRPSVPGSEERIAIIVSGRQRSGQLIIDVT